MTSTFLAPVAALYEAAVRARASFYRRGWMRSPSAGVPVLSVGNLVAGGTGKTPVTALVARLLQEGGLRPAIVSRGYAGRRGEDPLVVSDGTAVAAGATAARVGDEPLMLARLLPEVPVVVARRRSEGARLAVARLGARTIVLDDGFQHLALKRDLDLVLLDAASPFDNGRLLPAGLLRESPSALARAHAVALTGAAGDQAAANGPGAEGPSPLPSSVPAAVARWIAPGTPLFHISMEPAFVVSGRGTDPRSLRIDAGQDSGRFAGMKVVAFAGIARPHRLASDLRRLGAEVVSFLPYPDHHVYTSGDIRKIFGSVSELKPDALVTTEKDLARLQGTPHLPQLIERGLTALRIEAILPRSEEAAFREMILRAARGEADAPAAAALASGVPGGGVR